MTNKPQLVVQEVRESAQPALDLVIPVTTPELTRTSIQAAERLAAGLHAEIRLVRIQLVPFPLDLNAPPVPVEFLQEQLAHYESALPMEREVKLARDLETALKGALRPGSVVLMAAKRRPWKTRNERLAADLRRAGHSVILTYPDSALKGEEHA